MASHILNLATGGERHSRCIPGVKCISGSPLDRLGEPQGRSGRADVDRPAHNQSVC
jgi:hypothetical protein